MESLLRIEKMVQDVCNDVLARHGGIPDLAQLICDEAAKITAPYRAPIVTVAIKPETLTCSVEVLWCASDYYWLFGSVGDALD